MGKPNHDAVVRLFRADDDRRDAQTENHDTAPPHQRTQASAPIGRMIRVS
jgi:hypothetical protein